MAICPCELTKPCSPNCSCANPLMSGGCRRCCTYGSAEQQLESAKSLAEMTPLLGLICGCCGENKAFDLICTDCIEHYME